MLDRLTKWLLADKLVGCRNLDAGRSAANFGALTTSKSEACGRVDQGHGFDCPAANAGRSRPGDQAGRLHARLWIVRGDLSLDGFAANPGQVRSSMNRGTRHVELSALCNLSL